MIHRGYQFRKVASEHGLTPVEGYEIGAHIQGLRDGAFHQAALQDLALPGRGAAVDAVVGAGLHHPYGELIRNRPTGEGGNLGGEHSLEGQAWCGRNPGGEDESVRSGGDGLLISENSVHPLQNRTGQRSSRPPPLQTDDAILLEGLDSQQRLLGDLHLLSPPQVISSTMLSRRRSMGSFPEECLRASLAERLCSSMTLMHI